MTTQEKIAATLRKTGIPAKEIKCYGSQVMIVCWSEDAANKYRSVLHRFCSIVRPAVKSVATNKVNTNSFLLPDTHNVWLVSGSI